MEAACSLQRKARRNGRYHTLRSGPSLETLELQSYCCDDLSEAQTLPIVLRNLVKLRLCGIISSELTIFLLEKLIVPAVEEIAIFGDIVSGPHTNNSAADFHDQSFDKRVYPAEAFP
jgi:hypothetical protein